MDLGGGFRLSQLPGLCISDYCLSAYMASGGVTKREAHSVYLGE